MRLPKRFLFQGSDFESKLLQRVGRRRRIRKTDDGKKKTILGLRMPYLRQLLQSAPTEEATRLHLLVFSFSQFQDEESIYNETDSFECLPCSEGCETCNDAKPCVVTLNWLWRSVVLSLTCLVIFLLFAMEFMTWKYRNLKVAPSSLYLYYIYGLLIRLHARKAQLWATLHLLAIQPRTANPK